MRRKVTMGVTLCALAIPAMAADLIIDLQNGVVTETFNSAPTPAPVSGGGTTFTDSQGYARVTLVKKAGGCSTTPYEAKVEVSLQPSGSGVAPVQKLSVLVQHEGDPVGWSTHLGDDNNNDGFGGGSGLTGVAEVQVLDQVLGVYTEGFNPGQVDRLFQSQLRLNEGTLHFNVSNQQVSIGPPNTIINTTNQKQLFDFSSSDKKLYVAFNRVIRDGVSNRSGCGAKRAVLSFVN